VHNALCSFVARKGPSTGYLQRERSRERDLARARCRRRGFRRSRRLLEIDLWFPKRSRLPVDRVPQPCRRQGDALSGASSDPNVVTLSPGYLCWAGKRGGGEAFVGKCFASRINCNRLKWPREVGGYMRDMENSPGVAKLTKAPGPGDLRASQSGSGGYHRQGFTGALGQCREGAGEGCRRG